MTDITHLKVWLDAEGSYPALDLQKIVVIEFSTGKMYTFLGKECLSHMDDGCSAECLLQEIHYDPQVENISETNMDQKKSSVFQKHIVSSIFHKRSHSFYTRLQRVSVLFVLLFMMMVSSAMWYR